MSNTKTEAEQDVPLPDGFIMDGLPDGRIEYKRGFLRESDSLLRSCAPAWEARSIYRLHKELRRLDALCDERGANEARMLMRCAEMQATIDQLRAQLDQAVQQYKEDAERYRWLRERVGVERTAGGNGPVSCYLYSRQPALTACLEETDDAIAAAIRARSNT